MTNEIRGVNDAPVASIPCETPEAVPVVTNTQPEIPTEVLQACTRPDIDFTWNEDQPPGPQTHKLCNLLASSGELYRDTKGKLLWIQPKRKPGTIDTPVELEGFIRSKWAVEVIRVGKHPGFVIPSSHLNVLLKTRTLQEMLPVVDFVTEVPTYNASWQMTLPGHNPGPEGQNYYYTGAPVVPMRDPVRIREFIGALSFKDKVADAANLVGLALTVLLRNKFAGQKPFAVVTANRSHAGKDTALDFAAGRTLRKEVDYSPAEWPMQNAIYDALSDAAVGMLTIGNIRAGSSTIASSFIEKTITSTDPLLNSSKAKGKGYTRNGVVFGCSANQGRFSTDLMNRSLPICLELIGDVERRAMPLGNLLHDYLPKHRLEIEAELCGMIENWKDRGCPMADTKGHSMTEWAQTIGGILKANGFEGFLANWNYERCAQDMLSEALGIVANVLRRPKPKWFRVTDIVRAAVAQHVINAIIGSKHGHNIKAMERELGVVLSGLIDSSVYFKTEDGEIVTYRIRRERRRVGRQAARVYKFEPEVKAKE